MGNQWHHQTQRNATATSQQVFLITIFLDDDDDKPFTRGVLFTLTGFPPRQGGSFIYSFLFLFFLN
jgi:hypothetical protein